MANNWTFSAFVTLFFEFSQYEANFLSQKIPLSKKELKRTRKRTQTCSSCWVTTLLKQSYQMQVWTLIKSEVKAIFY